MQLLHSVEDGLYLTTLSVTKNVCIALVIYGTITCMEHWWNDVDREKPKYSEEYL